MEKYAFARVVHIIAIVLWIGGVAMVTTVLLPAIRRMASKDDRVAIFDKIESRFALQAKITTVLTGASGFYMLYYIDAWSRYAELRYWWMHAMTIVWVIFTLVLFVFEPLFLHRLFEKHAGINPTRTFAIVFRLHLVLLALSLVAIAGAVAGSHGWLLF
ncbi:MAG: hypothetical protein QGG34_01175 [SAR202 cluster bacterium]|jgi:uncharacterized membrane protein|nr:hypothetical protein [SAR202 cluster bacterium]MDP6300441.1 hypothetical protein [SAR202 cluster bacterium]MDP7102433.1 hypothetical protein [SAR202 cluster bacterium]MDP7224879.1 hypothetical protein [SAR202 cluster bacterium]MDP7412055.1 hypothetical protein [SAR202 cluster bacterium]|tara:strand:- start:3602 stop:4078 length:477 start_codon:yes stop_codon:yes gene_type:complete